MSQPKPIRNVLYIMCDQLRRDYLSCYGHPYLHTPNIDRLAAEGVRFARAYTQGTICGPSRMSSYTGRYVSSHQVAWNAVPLPLEELTLGDYLRAAGVRTALVGKTHATANLEGMRRLGIDPASARGAALAEAGFEPYDRNDGVYPDDPAFADKRESAPYTHYLRRLGFTGDNPWHDWANSAAGADGKSSAAGGCAMPDCRHACRRRTARPPIPPVAPWISSTSRASVPGACTCPTSSRTGPTSRRRRTTRCTAPTRCSWLRAAPGEESDHPVYRAFREHRESLNFSREDVRRQVIPTYMGLIRQVDDQLGRLFQHMRASGRWTIP